MTKTCNEPLDTYADLIHLPVDTVVAAEFAADSPSHTVAADEIPDDKMGLDIGSESVKRFTARLSNAKTIFWTARWGYLSCPLLPQARIFTTGA